MTALLDEKEALALEDIRAFLSRSKNPVLAFSGGKDAIVASHLVHQVADVPGVCEVSFYYSKQVEDIQRNTDRQGWQVSYRDSLSLEWLQARPKVPFTNDSSIRSAAFNARQQTTVRNEMKRFGYSGAIFGRRTQENSVPAKLYQVGGYDSFHPIRDWTEDEVWAYFEKHKIPVPWIYGTEHGKHEGNSPFTTLRAKDVGGIINAWRVASSLDDRYIPSFMGPQYEKDLRDTTDTWYW
jgi:3'-phosphoadenosine 5'-phosphosulfate sulfotransferase (PAPS reductase)/FAD synthetase